MRNLILLLAVSALLAAACNAPKPENAAPAKPAAIEFGDSAKANVLKAGQQALAAGDVDAFTNNLADNAVYMWNSGDSLAGKAAIVAYWKDRRGNVIDQMQITNDTWLVLKVNESKQVPLGEYALAWYSVTASYKGGKSMTQFVHAVHHFDATGKVDRITQYLDRVPIMAAMPPPPPAKK